MPSPDRQRRAHPLRCLRSGFFCNCHPDFAASKDREQAGEALHANESNLLRSFCGPISPQIAAVALSLKTTVAMSPNARPVFLRNVPPGRTTEGIISLGNPLPERGKWKDVSSS